MTRGKTMPRQRKTLGRQSVSKNAQSKASIKIAKPDMTLTGFEHTAKNI